MAAPVPISPHQTSLDHEHINPVVVSAQQAVGPSRWPRLLSRTDLAEYLAVSPRHIDTLVQQGHIPTAKFRPSPRLVRWDRADIDAAFDNATCDQAFAGRSFDELLGPKLIETGSRVLAGGR